jgi:hypothetical protein
MQTPTIAKRSDGGSGPGIVATWAPAVAQLVSWGSIYYAFSLFVVPMESAMGWLVSLISAVAFVVAVRLASRRKFSEHQVNVR